VAGAVGGAGAPPRGPEPARPDGEGNGRAHGHGAPAPSARPPVVGPPPSLRQIADRVGGHLDHPAAGPKRTAGPPSRRAGRADRGPEAPRRRGGQRLRPAFCHWTYLGAGGDPGDERLVAAAAAVELLHTFALIHDDVMDGADTALAAVGARRFIEMHIHRGWGGEHPRRFGEGAAIWSATSRSCTPTCSWPAPAPRRGAVFDELRLELCVGQYLDLATTAARNFDLERARRFERYKSGKYTVERPLHLGAALAGRLDDLAEPLSRIGLPLGEAFQLRDDVLGTFGDAEQLGKPVGADLRDGKLTPLVAVAWQRADASGRAVLDRIGGPDLDEGDLEAARRIVVETGALARAEARIGELLDDALAAIDAAPIAPAAAYELAELARFVAWRDR